MKQRLLRLVMAVMVTLGLFAAASPATAAPYCGITWGSLEKAAGPDYSLHQITNVRTGRHECFDRVVVDLNGRSASGYYIRYVNQVYTEGQGAALNLSGGAKIHVTIRAAAYDENYNVTYPATVGAKLPGVNLTGYQTLKDAKYGGSHEGQTTIGLGVRARLPFRVFKLDNRVVIDIAHRW